MAGFIEFAIDSARKIEALKCIGSQINTAGQFPLIHEKESTLTLFEGRYFG